MFFKLLPLLSVFSFLLSFQKPFSSLATSNVIPYLYNRLSIFSRCPLSFTGTYLYISIFGAHATLPCLYLSPIVSHTTIPNSVLYLNATPPRGPLLLITGPRLPHYVISLMSSWPYDLGCSTVGMQGRSSPN